MKQEKDFNSCSEYVIWFAMNIMNILNVNETCSEYLIRFAITIIVVQNMLSGLPARPKNGLS